MGSVAPQVSSASMGGHGTPPSLPAALVHTPIAMVRVRWTCRCSSTRAATAAMTAARARPFPTSTTIVLRTISTRTLQLAAQVPSLQCLPRLGLAASIDRSRRASAGILTNRTSSRSSMTSDHSARATIPTATAAPAPALFGDAAAAIRCPWEACPSPTRSTRSRNSSRSCATHPTMRALRMATCLQSIPISESQSSIWSQGRGTRRQTLDSEQPFPRRFLPAAAA